MASLLSQLLSQTVAQSPLAHISTRPSSDESPPTNLIEFSTHLEVVPVYWNIQSKKLKHAVHFTRKGVYSLTKLYYYTSGVGKVNVNVQTCTITTLKIIFINVQVTIEHHPQK